MATYSGKQFKVLIGGQQAINFGVAHQEAASNLYEMKMESINDIDFSGGVTMTDRASAGQRVMDPSDHFADRGGGSYTWAFDYAPADSEQILQMIIRSLLETNAPTGLVHVTGNQANSAYATGGTNNYILQMNKISPDASETRFLHSAVVNEATFSMDAGTNGGRLGVSGTLYSGFRPMVSASDANSDAFETAAGGTSTAFAQTIFDCHDIKIGGTAVVCKAFSLTVRNNAVRNGYATHNTNDGEPHEYFRGGMIEVEGSITVKMDDTTVALLNAGWLDGASKAILIGDNGTTGGGSATSIFFECPTAKLTGHNVDYGSDDGMFIEIPFMGTASGSGKLVSIKLT